MQSDVQKWLQELEHEGPLTEQSLKKAYRAQMRQHHPDRHHGNAEDYETALAKSKAINAAYAHLEEWLDTHPPFTQQTPSPQAHPSPRRQSQRAQPAPGFPDPDVLEVFVKSSNLYSCGYAATEEVLYIKFQDGAIYRYTGVSRALFDELLNSDSLGRFAHKNIYYKFHSERCL